MLIELPFPAWFSHLALVDSFLFYLSMRKCFPLHLPFLEEYHMMYKILHCLLIYYHNLYKSPFTHLFISHIYLGNTSYSLLSLRYTNFDLFSTIILVLRKELYKSSRRHVPMTSSHTTECPGHVFDGSISFNTLSHQVVSYP